MVEPRMSLCTSTIVLKPTVCLCLCVGCVLRWYGLQLFYNNGTRRTNKSTQTYWLKNFKWEFNTFMVRIMHTIYRVKHYTQHTTGASRKHSNTSWTTLRTFRSDTDTVLPPFLIGTIQILFSYFYLILYGVTWPLCQNLKDRYNCNHFINAVYNISNVSLLIW